MFMNRSFGKNSPLSQLSIAGATAVLINLGWSHAAIAAALYTLTDLGALTGGTSSYATGINNNGQVVGQAASAEGFRAFVWSATGGLVNLGTLNGSNFSYATGINDNGQVVGYANVNNTPVAWQWDGKGGMTSLSAVANASRSYAYGINNGGQIVGYANTGTDTTAATVWQGSQPPTELNNRSISSIATGVNEPGQIVGQIASADGFRAALWTAGTLTNLGTLNGGSYSYATGINDQGQVVGYSTIGKPPGSTSSGFLGTTLNAFIWNSSTGMTSLGSLSPQDNSYATGVNENGQVVGYSYGLDQGSYRYRAFMWDNGAMTDLNNLIDPALGWALNVANAVNDQGQIVGLGINAAGQSRAFLLTPSTASPTQRLVPDPINPTPPLSGQPENPVSPPVNNQPQPTPTPQPSPSGPINDQPAAKSVPESAPILGLGLVGWVGRRRWQQRSIAHRLKQSNIGAE
jgi:probable HAF family extracellular repeat protein